ncbi:hypothetical protein WOLCODRAFT_137881 [Wolfiporia cocos MD-104 SS10]|uniref:Peptidase M48 domain-containing protein n=1 Tax=Wolfiporia cocos (strain MD-104) TaxID=742152 RepID=A0A2H3JU09_WOLCO|nr:hypothetical protein WOLCODRAFT_137881 [Wolfiporia cocos MD-104 SS10]
MGLRSHRTSTRTGGTLLHSEQCAMLRSAVGTIASLACASCPCTRIAVRNAGPTARQWPTSRAILSTERLHQASTTGHTTNFGQTRSVDSTITSCHAPPLSAPPPKTPSRLLRHASTLNRFRGNGIIPRFWDMRPASPMMQHTRAFHITPARKGPHIPLLLAFLKTSTAIQFANTVFRVALTFVPVVFLKRLKARRILAKIDQKREQGRTDLDEKRERVVRRLRHSNVAFHILLLTPALLFWLTILASLERTPLTGRWRLILLSPEEEDDIAAQLAGPGWYSAIGELLSVRGPPRLVDPTDWRLGWVQDTLRRLEAVVPILQRERELVPDWMEDDPSGVPRPPPAEYPLRPRPRASEYFRRIAEAACARTAPTPPHAIPGPPYSLVVVDDPSASNAFSYGFGPDGGGGIVVFSGFLDDVLAKHPFESPAQVEAPPAQTSWLAYLFGSLFSISPPPSRRPVPTEEQTSELAILLAHELAHLLLTHHIETLSSSSIVWPGVMSIVTDVVRTLLFPFTMLFGPFINDALAGVGKVGSGEFTKITEYCTSQSQEIEADIVSARLLAHAGFDPRHAVRFWEGRHETPQTAECSPARAEQDQEEERTSLTRNWMGASHPVNVVRVERLRQELDRWDDVRRKAREQRERDRADAAAAV